jgi:hypothetical protein
MILNLDIKGLYTQWIQLTRQLRLLKVYISFVNLYCQQLHFQCFYIPLFLVQSYGTEDRSTAVFVHPKNDVYDFIIFKASDIKDLIVCEQPKASSLQNIVGANLPYDPAIVSISKIPPPEPKLPPKLNMMNNAAAGATLGGIKRTPGKSGGRGGASNTFS